MDNQNWIDITTGNSNHVIEMDTNARSESEFKYRHKPITFNDPIFDGWGSGAMSSDNWTWGHPDDKDAGNAIAPSNS